LTDDEGDGFDSFDFFLCSEEFSTEVVGFVEDVFLCEGGIEGRNNVLM
jgi:hypothetical protein